MQPHRKAARQVTQKDRVVREGFRPHIVVPRFIPGKPYMTRFARSPRALVVCDRNYRGEIEVTCI